MKTQKDTENFFDWMTKVRSESQKKLTKKVEKLKSNK